MTLAKAQFIYGSGLLEMLDISSTVDGGYFCYRIMDQTCSREYMTENDLFLCKAQQFYRDGDRVVAQGADGRIRYLRFEQGDGCADLFASVLGRVVGVVRAF